MEDPRGNMHLVMFDIDGTLIASSRIDTECFLQALVEGLGISRVDADWDHYKNATDQGCLEEIVLRNRNRMPTPAEIHAVKTRHLDLLRMKIASNPIVCQPIPGARGILRDLGTRTDVVVSLASGAWLESAKIKLEAAQIPYEGIAMATCDDAVSRTAIIQISRKRAQQRARCQAFSSTTYVGDAPWDAQAARLLGYGFIGISASPHADWLINAGALFVVPDFRDGAFERTLERLWNVRL